MPGRIEKIAVILQAVPQSVRAMPQIGAAIVSSGFLFQYLLRVPEKKRFFCIDPDYVEEETSLQIFLNLTSRLSSGINAIAGIAMTFIMLLTMLDVILRWFRMPITGTYELVAFSGAIVIGFALPLTSFKRGHIYVDFFLIKLPSRVQAVCNGLTRCLGILLFSLIGWNLIKVGTSLQKSGEVSMTLKLPFYPIAYGVACCCFIQCLVLVTDIVKISRGVYDE